ncbi:MAG TPA: hypothetical protein VGB92_25260 [Longimicrobium sp.]|jgi:hypothetical protein
MTRALLALTVPALLLAACASTRQPAEQSTLRAFRDEAELAEFNRRLERRRLVIERRIEAEERREAQWRLREARRPRSAEELLMMYDLQHHLLPPDIEMPEPAPPGLIQVSRFLQRPDDAPAHDAGGDERATVHLRGEELVLLRRGRLFTARLGAEGLQPLSMADAFGQARPVVSAYEELLVSGDHVVVVGASDRSTLLVLFRREAGGGLAHRATYTVPSGDEFMKSHTYAARVMDGRLVFYAPLPLDPAVPSTHRPAIQRLGGGAEPTSPARVYRSADRDPAAFGQVLHSVISCGFEDEGLRCRSTAVYAGAARVYHMSPTAVYAWVPPLPKRPAVLYRIPLDGTAPTSLQVTGEPVDEFAFQESGGQLTVLLHPQPRPRPGSDRTITGPLQLLRVPLSEFGDGRRAAAPSAYRTLPLRGSGVLEHRWVGDWLLYGLNMPPATVRHGYASGIYAVPPAGSAISEVDLPHVVDRIEPMGSGAVVAGTDGRQVHVTGVRLGPAGATLGQTVPVPGDSSFGVLYHPDGNDSGIVAVPFRRRGPDGAEPTLLGANGIRFLRTREFGFEELGDVAGEFATDDYCATSCSHWYGDTRPIFANGRIFALLGGEMVEAREEQGRLRELHRVRFAPPPPAEVIAGSWRFEEITPSNLWSSACRSRGTMTLDRDGDRLSMRFRQAGECTFGGVTAPSGQERTGRGTSAGKGVEFQVETCRYAGGMVGPDLISGTFRCLIPGADGTPRPFNGFWEARRVR